MKKFQKFAKVTTWKRSNSVNALHLNSYDSAEDYIESCNEIRDEQQAAKGSYNTKGLGTACFEDNLSGSQKAFHKTENWNEALDVARYGEDLEKVKVASEWISKEVEHESVEMNFQVFGAYPDIDRYLSGIPENMVNFEISESRGKFIDLVINNVDSAIISTNKMTNRSAAIVSAVESMELNGYAVRVRCLSTLEDRGDRKTIYATSILIKDYDMPCSMEYIMGMLSASTFRRLFFAQTTKGAGNGGALQSAEIFDSVATATGNVGEAVVCIANMESMTNFSFETPDRAKELTKWILKEANKSHKKEDYQD